MNKNYFGIIKKKLIYMIIAFPLQLVSSVCSILIPLSYQILIDRIISKEQYNLLLSYTMFIGMVFLIYIITDIVSNIIVIKCSAAVKESMKYQLMSVILNRKTKQIDRLNKGEIIARITQDVDIMVNVVAEYFIPTVTGIIMFSFMTIMIFQLSTVLGIFCLTASPLFFLCTRIFGKAIERQATFVNAKSEKFLNIVDECIEARTVVRFFNCFDYEIRRFHEILKDYISAGRIFLVKNIIAKKTFSGIGTLFPLILLAVGTSLIIKKEITLGILVSVLSCLNYILIPSTVLSNCLIGVKQFKVSAGRLELFFQEHNESLKNNSINFDQQMTFGLTVKNLCFSFQDYEVFRNINFCINDKEFISIVGENGVGKSTLLNILKGLIYADKGDVFIGNVKLTKESEQYLNKHISPILQDEFLFEDTVQNNIYFKKPRKIQLEKNFFNENFMNKNAGKNGINLSGGEKQKVVLARALNKDCEILIIDEGSTNIDLNNLDSFYRILQKIKGSKTILIIDHHMGFIDLSDRILYIEDKNKVILDRHKNLLAYNNKYQNLYQKSVRR